MNLVPGTLVDRYRVEAELGRGGMARVYRVRHKNLGTLHALKLLTVSSEDLRARLLQEGRLQARLDHPGLVPVRDVLEGDSGPGLLMDFIDGPTLDGWLLQERPDEGERERVFLEILEGVAFAHAQGVVHRDLKPGNVLMERRRGVWHPRVADFGLAKVIGGEEEGDAGLSRTGRPMGTPAYMAPEQVRSAKHVDHRADVFALGCILYELVTGRRAFVGDDSLEVFNRVARGRFVPPRELVPGLPSRVEAAILGAMEVDAAARVPNAETLGAVLRGEMAWEPRPSLADRTMGAEDWDAAPVAPARSAPTMLLSTPGTLAPVAHSEPVSGAPVAEVGRDPAASDPAAAPVDMDQGHAPPAAGVRSRPGVALVALALLAAVAWWAGRPAPVVPTVPAVVPVAPTVPAVVPVAPTAPAAATVAPAAGTASRASAVAEDPRVERKAPAPAAPRPDSPAPESRGSRGRVLVTGDAREVTLRGADGTRRSPGEVPAGSYVLEARFDDGPPMHAGNVVVRPGVTHRVDCRAAMLGCNE